MPKHLPPVPPANQSPKGPGEHRRSETGSPAEEHREPAHVAEQGETANIKQNTTNKGFFAGRRVK